MGWGSPPSKKGNASAYEHLFGRIPATRDFGVTYRGFRECIMDLVRQLREEVLRGAEADKS